MDTPAKVVKLTYNLSGIGLSEQDIAELLNKHGVPKTDIGDYNIDDHLSDIYLSAYKLKLTKVINEFEESTEHIHTLLDDKHYDEFRKNTDEILSTVRNIIK
jgi:exonuclease III